MKAVVLAAIDLWVADELGDPTLAEYVAESRVEGSEGQPWEGGQAYAEEEVAANGAETMAQQRARIGELEGISRRPLRCIVLVLSVEGRQDRRRPACRDGSGSSARGSGSGVVVGAAPPPGHPDKAARTHCRAQDPVIALTGSSDRGVHWVGSRGGDDCKRLS